MREEILYLFSENYKRIFYDILQRKELEEIRFRMGKPVLYYAGGQEYFAGWESRKSASEQNAVLLQREELDEILQRSCRFSPYAYELEFRQGYLPLPGGHRLGITGRVVCDRNEVLSMKYFNGLNLRIAREHFGIAEPALPYLYKEGRFLSCLIIAPPGAGKTSLLRDCIRLISNGNKYGEGRNVSVIDERSELAACYEGTAQMNLGIRTDVLDGCPKEPGVQMVLRSMNPAVIAMDELGGQKDFEALLRISRAGVALLASIHGEGCSNGRQDREPGINFCPDYFERFITIKQTGKGLRRYRIYDVSHQLLAEYASSE